MSERTERDATGRRWTATAVWLATVALAAIGAADALRHATMLAGGARLALIIAVSAVATAGIGVVVAGKTGNAVGWLLGAGGLALSGGLLAAVSAANACDRSTVWRAVVATAGPAAWWACVTTSVSLYPRGRLGRGRSAAVPSVGPALAWVGVAGIIVAALSRPAAAIHTMALGDCAHASAPATMVVAFVLLGAGYAAAAALAIRRLRLPPSEERQQLMPVAAAVAAVALLLVTAPVVEPWARPLSGDAPWVVIAWVVAGLGIPLAVSVSVIRHRAFGIYRFIDYMTDYRMWTVGLAALGVAAATGIGWGITALVGLHRQPVAVGLATLAGAAAIMPLWRRRRAAVDARFGQHQSDPAAVLEALAATVADEDAGTLRGPIFDLLGRFAPIVIVQGEAGMRFAVRTDDREIGRHTFVNGAYDLGTMRSAMRLLEAELGRGPTPLAGRSVLDVGANIGISIVPLLRLFGAERGICVEPEPNAVEMLRLNLALNDLTGRVQIMPIGLSDRDGSLELELSAENFGDHRLRVPGTTTTRAETGARPTVTVPVRRLDALVEGGELDGASLGLIWLDVQGHEGHVLSGARALLGTPIPVLTEFWPSAMERAGGLDLFREVVSSRFTRIADVRVAEAEGHVETVPVSRMDELVERYAGPTAFTDLLLLP